MPRAITPGGSVGNSRDGIRHGAAAVALRVSGASFSEIAETLALANPAEALALVERELASHLTTDDIDLQRNEASTRILTLLQSVWDTATTPGDPERLTALRLALALVDRHIRLHGLDRPTEITLRTPAAAELERWVATLTANNLPDVIEADILGATTRELQPGT